jgi:hypothetical protein
MKMTLPPMLGEKGAASQEAGAGGPGGARARRLGRHSVRAMTTTAS